MTNTVTMTRADLRQQAKAAVEQLGHGYLTQADSPREIHDNWLARAFTEA